MQKPSDSDFEKLRTGEWGKQITAERLSLYESYLEQKPFLKDSTGIDLEKCKGAILRRNDIISLSDTNTRKLPLIHPFDKNDPDKLLKPASYSLKLGCHYRVNDKEGFLSLDNPTLVIPKHGIAIVTTYEWLNIPLFLIGRWNIRVHRVYDGLVWVGGPQVDPGYQGFLFCPIYNLSNHDQAITYNRRLFTIDFSLTTPVNDQEVNEWKPIEPRHTFTFWGLDQQKIQSGPEHDFTEIRDSLTKLKDEISDKTEKLDTKVQKFQEWSVILIGIIIALIAIMATFGAGSIDWSKIDPIGTTFVGVAIGLSIVSIILVLWKTRKPKIKQK